MPLIVVPIKTEFSRFVVSRKFLRLYWNNDSFRIQCICVFVYLWFCFYFLVVSDKVTNVYDLSRHLRNVTQSSNTLRSTVRDLKFFWPRKRKVWEVFNLTFWWLSVNMLLWRRIYYILLHSKSRSPLRNFIPFDLVLLYSMSS